MDDWEVEREDVDIGAELGKGSFGMVYKGTFKDPKKVQFTSPEFLLNDLKGNTFNDKFMNKKKIKQLYSTLKVIIKSKGLKL